VAKRSSEELPEPRRTEKVTEDEDLDRIREAVLYDEWQERRARRATRRERRRLDRYNHRESPIGNRSVFGLAGVLHGDSK